MTVRNEFLGGFQHNMRNDYVKGALKGKERLQGVVQEHAPQRPLLPRPGPARLREADARCSKRCGSDPTGRGGRPAGARVSRTQARAGSLTQAPGTSKRMKNGVLVYESGTRIESYWTSIGFSLQMSLSWF